jgi:hypothetical protein
MTEKLTFDQAVAKTMMVDCNPPKDIPNLVFYGKHQFSMAKYQILMIILHISALAGL